MVYRSGPKPKNFHLEATVRGPLAPVPIRGHVSAFDERSAVETFVEGLRRDGFEIVGEARVWQ
jgi:hypothetical protein